MAISGSFPATAKGTGTFVVVGHERLLLVIVLAAIS